MKKRKNQQKSKTNIGLIPIPKVKGTTAYTDQKDVNKRAFYRIHTETELARINRTYHTLEEVDKDLQFKAGSWVELVHEQEDRDLQHSIESETTIPSHALRVENDDVPSAVCRFR